MSCPVGTKLLDGGANITQGGTNATKAAVSASYPSNATTWTGTAIVTVTDTGSASITAFAICGS